jgi:tRNA threonylcarbamoyl adenosine modification protein YjeE
MAAKPGRFAVQFVARSTSDTAALAARIAAGLKVGDTVALAGDLGAGKTTLARAILRALGVVEAVPSPTFTLIQQYQTDRLTVSHYDLYRIEKPSEMEELALNEALSDGAALIEWPERAGFLPADALHVHLEIVGESARRIEISGPLCWAEFLASGADVGGS